MLPVPKGEERPAPAKCHFLGLDDDYREAPKLSALAKVFNQDTLNLPCAQRGLKSPGKAIFANYGETKPRHFHKKLAEQLGLDELPGKELLTPTILL